MGCYSYKVMMEAVPPEIVDRWMEEDGTADYDSTLWVHAADYIDQLKNEVNFYKSAMLAVQVVDVKELRKRLNEMPDIILENEKKNPVRNPRYLRWIEKALIPNIRALCQSAAALLERK